MAPTISTALPVDALGAPYDRHAAAYDRLDRNRLYNRLLWGTSPAAYRAFAAEAVADAEGPLHALRGGRTEQGRVRPPPARHLPRDGQAGITAFLP